MASLPCISTVIKGNPFETNDNYIFVIACVAGAWQEDKRKKKKKEEKNEMKSANSIHTTSNQASLHQVNFVIKQFL